MQLICESTLVKTISLSSALSDKKFEHGKGASREQISRAESALGFKFPNDYIEMLTNYGYLDLGSYEISGTGKGHLNVVDITLKERKLHIGKLTKVIVISTVSNGNLVVMDRSGNIFFHNHNDFNLERAARSLPEFIVNHCN